MIPNKGIPFIAGAQLPSSIQEAGIEFDLLAPYSACLICGEVFQSTQDLFSRIDREKYAGVAANLRYAWRVNHASKHTQTEHDKLRQSPDIMTVEASQRLGPLGIVPLDGSVDIFDSLGEAPRIPDARIRTGI